MPPSLQSRPSVPPHLKAQYNCYLRLRKVNLELGLVTFTEVSAYATQLGILGSEEQLDFYDVVRAFDIQRLVTTKENQSQDD